MAVLLNEDDLDALVRCTPSASARSSRTASTATRQQRRARASASRCRRARGARLHDRRHRRGPDPPPAAAPGEDPAAVAPQVVPGTARDDAPDGGRPDDRLPAREPADAAPDGERRRSRPQAFLERCRGFVSEERWRDLADVARARTARTVPGRAGADDRPRRRSPAPADEPVSDAERPARPRYPHLARPRRPGRRRRRAHAPRGRSATRPVPARPSGYRVDVAEAVSAPSRCRTRARERALDELRWRLADELAVSEPDGFAALLARAVQLRLAWRWAAVGREAGWTALEASAAADRGAPWLTSDASSPSAGADHRRVRASPWCRTRSATPWSTACTSRPSSSACAATTPTSRCSRTRPACTSAARSSSPARCSRRARSGPAGPGGRRPAEPAVRARRRERLLPAARPLPRSARPRAALGLHAERPRRRRVRAGDTLGTVPEGEFEHRVMVPFGARGAGGRCGARASRRLHRRATCRHARETSAVERAR
jgi:hypothetical protein